MGLSCRKIGAAVAFFTHGLVETDAIGAGKVYHDTWANGGLFD